jgi:hypothetical protein
MLKTAQETVQAYQATSPKSAKRASPAYEVPKDATKDVEDGSDDDFGPAPPTQLERRRGHGPTVPKMDDLTYRNETRAEDRARNRSDYADDIRYERKTDRKAQKEQLDELVPRADPGSRERQMEKKREVTSTLQSFRDAKESGDVEVAESDLMGDDGIDMYKKKKKRGLGMRRGTRGLRKGERRRAKRWSSSCRLPKSDLGEQEHFAGRLPYLL